MKLIAIDYTNWRGERRWRVVEPTGEMRFESNEWHPTAQWLMFARDKSGDVKGYALCNIHRIIAEHQTMPLDVMKELAKTIHWPSSA